MKGLWGFDKETFWSVFIALLLVMLISGLFSHALDHTGQKITGAKSKDATLAE